MTTAAAIVLVLALVMTGVLVGLGIARVEDAHRSRARAAVSDPWFEGVVDAVEEYLKAYEAWRDAPQSDREWRLADKDTAKERVVEMWEAGR